jgi:hypothetical protein
MDGEKKFVLVTCGLTAICVTVLYVFLFLSLWQYKEWVGGSLLTLCIASVGVYVRGRLTEQELRQVRFRYHEETPLDEQGEPRYWHGGFQENPYRQGGAYRQKHSEYHSYQTKQ